VLDLDTSAAAPGAAPVTITNPDGQSTVVNVPLVGLPPSLSATKTVAGDFVDTHAVVYTVTITNAGPGTQFDNPGSDEFIDVLPASLLLTGATATSGVVTVDVPTNTVRWNGSLAPAASVTITIDAVIYAPPGTEVVNQGTVFEDSDGNGTNDTPIPTDDPTVGGTTDPTVFTVLGVLQVIPTLGNVGFILLAGALALLSVWWIRRRRAA
jgi:hypothetical protein